MSKNGWTPERRKRQSILIRNWKPWQWSTGPQTTEGKVKAKNNAHKHGLRGEEGRKLKTLKKLLREYDIVLGNLLE